MTTVDTVIFIDKGIPSGLEFSLGFHGIGSVLAFPLGCESVGGI
jgi:hypothetical protein